jgi:cell division protease FtsH
MKRFIFILLINFSQSLINKLPQIINKLPQPINKSQFIDIIQNHKEQFIYNDYSYLINNNHISNIFINNNLKEIIAIENGYYHHIDVNPLLLQPIINIAINNHIEIQFIEFMTQMQYNLHNLYNQIIYLLPIIVIYFLISGFKNNIPNIISQFEFVKPNVTLSSWIGSPEIIDECKEIISYIENKKLYESIGAKMPKGFLLEGPPGTGKTLLAKAIATETNSSFIAISGSEFVEMFVGLGALKIKNLFKTARKAKPCIIFIDEIDAVGKQRGINPNIGNDEREQTLNQLLYEMDGFNNNTDIFVLAATNRKDILDTALLRPGRFDRIIKIPLPDKQSRKELIDYYLNNKKVDHIFNSDSLSELINGFSGAQIDNLINEAAILSVKNNYTVIKEKYLFESFEKIVVGVIKKNVTINPEIKLRTSLHEAGHAFLVLKFYKYFDFLKVSIHPTYNGAGGYTLFNDKITDLYTKDFLKKK